MMPRPAQYLLRFDDLCPTIPSKRWEQFRRLVEKFAIRPILAVVPDNRDPDLDRSPADPTFWDSMREMEQAGAVIAVHGYRHSCEAKGRSLLRIHRTSEFAGVCLETQREWIGAGFNLLRERNLHPRLWVGPRHGFDRNTLRALSDLGVEYISDGFARVPYRWFGVTWIPQQLWAPVVKSNGLWTICIHPHAASSSDVERLEWFLQHQGHQFTCFDRVLREFASRPLDLRERLYERIALWRVQKRQQRRRRRRGQMSKS